MFQQQAFCRSEAIPRVQRLNIDKVHNIGWCKSMDGFERDQKYFKLNAIFNRQPMQFLKEWRNMTVFAFHKN